MGLLEVLKILKNSLTLKNSKPSEIASPFKIDKLQKFLTTLGSFFFRFIYFGGSHSDAVFEDIDKRFFATDRKMVNLVNSRDGFFNFDSRLKIFSNM